jgi:hypothetical protein
MMAFDYDFVIIARREAASRLAISLADHLTADDGRLLREFAVSSPGNPIMAVVSHLGESYFWAPAYVFDVDPVMQMYFDEGGSQGFENGQAVFRTIWTSMVVGDEYLMFRAYAALDRLSLLFDYSPSIQATFSRIAESAGALMVLIDYLDDDLREIWPNFASEVSRIAYDGEGDVDQAAKSILGERQGAEPNGTPEDRVDSTLGTITEMLSLFGDRRRHSERTRPGSCPAEETHDLT